MSKIKCIIIEDEPLATKVLSDYILQTPFLELQATAFPRELHGIPRGFRKTRREEHSGSSVREMSARLEQNC